MTYPIEEHYVKQPETLAYLNHVTDKHDLRKDMVFNTELRGADWSDSDDRWHLTVSDPDSDEISDNKKLSARYVIAGLGLLSTTNFPDIPGLRSFEGDLHHTARWPKDYDVTGKSVGVIGCGSTGIQVITEIAQKVGRLECYQRHPQYSVPSGDRKVTPEDRDFWNQNWDQIWDQVRNSITAFGFKESTISYHDVGPEEVSSPRCTTAEVSEVVLSTNELLIVQRERIFQDAWDKGNGFRFMFATFNDISTDAEANEGACDFIRRQIDKIVKNPEKAKKLKPWDVYARRPLCDGNASNGQKYFEQFNRDNVDIVDLKETSIKQIEAKGIRTSDGKLHEHDVIIFATGFDAVEGSYTRLLIRGRDGKSLKNYWDEMGPTSYLGVSVPDFPNYLMISGPKGPFTNNPPAIEAQVEFITEAIQRAEAEQGPKKPIEATHEAEKEYSELCDKLAANSLFWKAEVSFHQFIKKTF